MADSCSPCKRFKELVRKEDHYFRNWTGIFLLGLLNSFAHGVVIASAKSLSEGFEAENLIGVFVWSNSSIGLFIRLVNGFVCACLSSSKRLALALLCSILGLVGVAISPLFNFWFAVASIGVIGAAHSLGESVILGYLRVFQQPRLAGAWASGTGFSGVFASLVYVVLFSFFELDNSVIYALLMPTVALYILVYALWLKPPSRDPYSHLHIATVLPDETQPLLQPPQGALKPVAAPPLSIPSSRHTVWCGLCHIFPLMLQLFGVYFFEYVALVGCGSKANPVEPRHLRHKHPHQPFWIIVNAYEILTFCYQVGVFLSRASLPFFHIRRTSVLVLLQAGNFTIWFLNVKYHFLNIYLQFLSMFFVGVCAGLAYVNIFYKAIKDTRFTEVEREPAINMVTCAVNLGQMASAAFDVLVTPLWLDSS